MENDISNSIINLQGYKINRITEGFHNKMEMMTRRAYGFRNFNNYRMKVRVACG
jgi:transposase